MGVILVGEDMVTREIIRRLLRFAEKDFVIDREEPVRGGQILELLPKYN